MAEFSALPADGSSRAVEQTPGGLEGAGGVLADHADVDDLGVACGEREAVHLGGGLDTAVPHVSDVHCPATSYGTAASATITQASTCTGRAEWACTADSLNARMSVH